MSVAYKRPFHPLDFATRAAALFSLGDMVDELRHEQAYRTANRSALTLIHDDGLTAVLTVAKQGAQCEDHCSQVPTVFIMLDGELAIESASDGGIIYLPNGSAGALARRVRHSLSATTDCAYLMVMGGQNTTEMSAGVHRHAPAGGRPTARSVQSASSEAEPDTVESLVDRLMRRIDAAPAAKRGELREYARDQLAADLTRAQAMELPSSRRRAPLNALGEAFLLGVVGLAFALFLPPVGVVLITVAGLMAAAGMLRIVTADGTRSRTHLLRLGTPRERRSAGMS